MSKASAALAVRDELPLAENKPAIVTQTAEAMALMFERLASNPAVDVDKLERLIGMQERILERNAKAEYYAAFAEMQGEIPVITEKGEIKVDGKLRSKYARNEDIQEIVKPILQRHGFMLSFRTEFPTPTTVKVIGVLAHRAGHSEQTEFISAADTSGSKNGIQALGSAQSYGQRYTTVSLLNIASRDDDGKGAGLAELPKAPAGFEAWLAKLTATADKGIDALHAAFKNGERDHRLYLTANLPNDWEEIKGKALRAGK